MGSTYLARITDICSDIAVKLVAAPSRDEKASSQSQSARRSDENADYNYDNYTSSRQPRVLRNVDRQSVVAPNVQRVTDKEVIGGVEFATFVRELDALRLRMVGSSLYERLGALSQRATMGDASRGAPPLPYSMDDASAQKSIQDAVTSAVLLLDRRGNMARRQL